MRIDLSRKKWKLFERNHNKMFYALKFVLFTLIINYIVYQYIHTCSILFYSFSNISTLYFIKI